jgi:uncharacterized membrane protein
MNLFILWILDRFQGLFRFWEVDYNQLRLIVEVKLTMDNRRTYTAFRQTTQPDAEKNNRFLAILLWYAFMSLIMGGIFVFLLPSLFWSGTFFFGYTMFVIGMALVSDFSNILLDTADNQIILPLPVNSKTLLFARIVHIISYLLLINLAVSLFPSIMFGFKYGWVAGSLILLFSFQNSLLVVALANLFYLLVLKFSSEEKLRNIINSVQIFTTVFFAAAYQLIPRMLNTSDLVDKDISIYWWNYLIPPFWFAASAEAITHNYYTPDYLTFIGLMTIIPIFTFWLINKYLAPVFSQRIALLGTGVAGNETVSLKNVDNRKTLSEKLSVFFTRSVIEKTGFELAWKLTSRDRKFKLRTYPAFGSIIPIILVTFFKNGSSFTENFDDIRQSHVYFFIIYIAALIPLVFFQNMAFSDDFKASWFYRSTPLDTPGKLLAGALKAVLVKTFVPIFFCIGLLLFFIWGTKILPDLLLGFIIQLLFTQVYILASKHYFPFSAELTQSEQTGSGLKILGIMVVESLTGYLHFTVSKIDYVAIVASVVLIPVVVLVYERYKKIGWDQMQVPGF